jgi:outer membrane protein TolC
VKLTVPLDFGVVTDIRDGYRAQAMAQDYLANKARFDLEQDWQDLRERYREAIDQLQVARELEKVQDEKIVNERNRFQTGRTTSFQVLQFEDNFFDSQLNRLRIENQILSLRATARLYNGDI